MAEIKISDEQFLAILRENAGLFAKTAEAIEQTLGIKYTRQAVRQRALEHKDELEDIEEEALDIAEAGMLALSKSLDEDVKFKACQFILKTKAKKRGYVERQEITGADGKPVVTETHVKIIRDTGIKSPLTDTPSEAATNTGQQEAV